VKRINFRIVFILSFTCLSSGLIAASVEIGGVMSVVFVSYFGATRHIPNWIGFGALITGVGTLVFTLPHMMAPAYTVTGGLNSSRHVENTCRGSLYRWFEEGAEEVVGAEGVDGECLSKESGQFGYVLTLVVAQMLIGIGGSPIYTLGTTYIDNHVSKLKAPSYIGKCTLQSVNLPYCTLPLEIMYMATPLPA